MDLSIACPGLAAHLPLLAIFNAFLITLLRSEKLFDEEVLSFILAGKAMINFFPIQDTYLHSTDMKAFQLNNRDKFVSVTYSHVKINKCSFLDEKDRVYQGKREVRYLVLVSGGGVRGMEGGLAGERLGHISRVRESTHTTFHSNIKAQKNTFTAVSRQEAQEMC